MGELFTSTFLDTLINVSWFTEGPEAKNPPFKNRWKSPSV